MKIIITNSYKLALLLLLVVHCSVGFAQCDIPSNLESTVGLSDGYNSAQLRWDSVVDAVSYVVRYKLEGSTSISQITVASPNTTLVGLKPSSSYTWSVQSRCTTDGTISSNVSTGAIFNTGSDGISCAQPANLNFSTGVTNGYSSAFLSWEGAVSSDYILRYKVQASNLVSQIVVKSNSFNLVGLEPSTQYTWTVQKKCTGTVSSEISLASQFTTVSAEKTCDTPSNLVSTNGEIDGYPITTLQWQGAIRGISYIVKYKAANSTQVQQITTYSNSLILSGLNPTQSYTWTVQTLCEGTVTSAASTTANFVSGAAGNVCNRPTNLNATTSVDQNMYNRAILSWDAVPGAAKYFIQYGPTGTQITVESSTNSISIAGLTANSLYKWRVKSWCTSDGIISSEFATGSFTSGGEGLTCNSPTSPLVSSQFSSNGKINVTLGWTGVSFANYYFVWYKLKNTPKWNIVTTGVGNMSSTFTINELEPLSTYQWYVQTSCSADGTSRSYVSTLGSFTTKDVTCETPVNLQAVPGFTNGFNSAYLSWSSVPDALEYLVRYRASGSTTTQQIYTKNTNINLTGLLSNTQYFWTVQSRCTMSGTFNSKLSAQSTFTTLNGTSCDVPSNLSSITGPTSAALNWASVQEATAFVVRYKVEGAVTSFQRVVYTNSIILQDLTPNTNYFWSVQTQCGFNINSSISPGASFFTFEPLVFESGTSESKSISSSDDLGSWRIMDTEFIEGKASISLQLYPNPSSTYVIITCNTEEIDASQLIIYDRLGSVVFTKYIHGSIDETVDISSFNTGIYIVKVVVQNREMLHRKLIVQ